MNLYYIFQVHELEIFQNVLYFLNYAGILIKRSLFQRSYIMFFFWSDIDLIYNSGALPMVYVICE